MHPGGFEPPTARFVAEYSIQLSYGCIGITTLLLIQCRSTCRNTDKDGASGRIRTSDRSVRSRVLYPAELRMQMAVRRGFEPRMQLLTAYSLSRGAPSASRPPHHTPLTSASKNLFLLIVAAWRTYYFLGLISQTIFPRVLSFAHFTHN